MDLSIRGHFALSPLDLTASGGAVDLTTKGVLDFTAMDQNTPDSGDITLPTQMRSPLSSYDSEVEHHDDTGYSSAVSSIGSTSTSPAPLNAMDSGSALSATDTAGSPEEESDVFGHQAACKDLLSEQDNGLPLAEVFDLPTTLSSVMYDEVLGVHDLSISLASLAESCTAEDLSPFDSAPPRSLSSDQADPLLSSSGISRGHEVGGSVSNVMEDMELLEDLLERITDCDNSRDSVFTSPILPLNPSSADSSLFPLEEQTLSEPLNLSSRTCEESQDNVAEKSHPQHPLSVLVSNSDCHQQPTLLRTLLDRQDITAKKCPSEKKNWPKPSPTCTVTPDKLSRTVTHDKSDACLSSDTPSLDVFPQKLHPCVFSNKPNLDGGLVVVPPLRSCLKNKGTVCVSVTSPKGNRKHPAKLIIRQAIGSHSLSKQKANSRQQNKEKDEEAENAEDKSCGYRTDLPPALPDELLDFAMQYSDTLSDMDTTSPEDIQGLHSADVSSNVHDIMAKNVPKVSIESSQSKSGKNSISEKLSDSSSGANQKVTGEKEHFESLPESAPAITSKAEQTPRATSASSPVIQSSVISSTLQEVKPLVSLSFKATPRCGLRGLLVRPLVRDKAAAQGSSSVTAQTASVKILAQTSPALSDHEYSFPHASPPSPSPDSPHALSNPPHDRGSNPPDAKRMRTERDETENGEGGERTILQSLIRSFPMPTTKLQQPSPRSQESSPISDTASAADSAICYDSDGNDSHIQSPSPDPAPVPANGGGKPLNAMSELEKHLRGLVAPPDERQKESHDLLTSPVEECLLTGSRSFLELLLTGELSDERYRQIDYQLLYQERERRLLKNKLSS